MQSLIQADQIFALWGALFAIVALAFWIERLPGKISGFGPISLIVVGLVASNTGILPRSSDSYDIVIKYFVPLSIPLLLFGADLVAIWREARRLLLVFMIGALGTSVGAIVALMTFDLGADTANYAGMFSATYIGGSVNFAAVSQMLEVDQTPMMAPALAANSIAATLYLILLVAVPTVSFIARRFHAEHEPVEVHVEPSDTASDGPLTPLSISIAIALSAAINVIGFAIADAINIGYAALLFVTAITVMIATARPTLRRHTGGHYQLGSLLIYVFFVLIGVTSDLRTLFEGGAIFVLFAAVILFFHACALLLGAKLFRFTLAEAVTASNACALGPASAAALTVTRGWHSLTTPAVLLGVFGYFIANFIGLAIAKGF